MFCQGREMMMTCVLLGIFVFVLSGLFCTLHTGTPLRYCAGFAVVPKLCFSFLFFIFFTSFFYFAHRHASKTLQVLQLCQKKNLFFFCICAPVRLQDTVHVERYCDIVVLHFFFIVHTDKPPGHVTSCAVVPKKKNCFSFLYLAHR